jgi:hypothetical protein
LEKIRNPPGRRANVDFFVFPPCRAASGPGHGEDRRQDPAATTSERNFPTLFAGIDGSNDRSTAATLVRIDNSSTRRKMSSNEEIAELLEALLADARQKAGDAVRQYNEYDRNKTSVQPGSPGFSDYKRTHFLLSKKKEHSSIRLSFMADQDEYLSALMDENSEKLDAQLRVAEALAKTLRDLVETGEELNAQVGQFPTDSKEYEDLTGKRRAFATDLARFESAIGGDAAARLHLYDRVVVASTSKAGLAKAGSDDESSGDDDGADIDEAYLAEVSCAELR